jgi:hypothetical protein
MQRRSTWRWLLPVALAVGAAGCSADAPTSLDLLEPQLQHNPQVPRHSVQVCKTGPEGTGGTFSVTMSGTGRFEPGPFTLASAQTLPGNCGLIWVSDTGTDEATLTITETPSAGSVLDVVTITGETTPAGGPIIWSRDGNTVTVSVTPIVDGVTVYFKNIAAPVVPPASLGDRVWHDLNGNGIQEPGEPGILGVTVQLRACPAPGAVLATRTADGEGMYLFSDLAPGSYYVTFVRPDGYVFSAADQGSNDATDSDADPATGATGCYTLAAGENNLTVDAGLYGPVSVGDFVWNDTNADGIQDAGEPGINGVVMTLTGTTGAGVSVSLSTTTAGNGGYLFTGLPPGTYTVTVATANFGPSAALAGFLASATGIGSDRTVDSNASPSGTMPAALPSGASDRTVDFGYYREAVGVCPVDGPVGISSLGSITDHLFFFSNGSVDANWQSASKGFVGNVAINGIQAKERTSGSFAFAGTIFTNDATLGAWQKIVDSNAGQAAAATGESTRISQLTTALENSFAEINALAATPGYQSRSATSLNGMNTQNGVAERIVVNVTSGFGVSSQINITGDAGDVFVLRWDTDANPANGYQGQVKFQSGGAIVPRGDLTAANFVHVAGDINASGGGSNPPPLYPQGPRLENGQGALIAGAQNFSGGGFFTGYWLTTGDPVKRETASLSNAIFVGGWYSTTTKFSMTSGTSGVHVACP